MRRCSIKKAKRIAKKYLSIRRYKHSLEVARMARDLARHWGARESFVVRAALLHDLGYSFQGDALAHASIGGRRAGLAGCDKKIVRAIRLHTLGGGRMSLEEKILFLADGIENSRDYPGVEEIRQLAFYDLDKALLAYLRSTKKYLEKQGKTVHEKSLHMERELKRRKSGRVN